MKFTQGAIVLTPFPFSNQKSTKLRPGLIISSDQFNAQSKDVWITAVSSKEGTSQFKIPLNQEDLIKGNLYRNSFVKFTAITATEKTIIQKVVGQVSKQKILEVKREILKIL